MGNNYIKTKQEQMEYDIWMFQQSLNCIDIEGLEAVCSSFLNHLDGITSTCTSYEDSIRVREALYKLTQDIKDRWQKAHINNTGTTL